MNFSFSGHESFQCRTLWLKKGYEFVRKGKDFNSADAVVELGVGKNMVTSISFWLKAFGLVDEKKKLNPIAEQIFSDKGFDPYLELRATLWLLHYHLVSTGKASLYNLMFNQFRKETPRYTLELATQAIT